MSFAGSVIVNSSLATELDSLIFSILNLKTLWKDIKVIESDCKMLVDALNGNSHLPWILKTRLNFLTDALTDSDLVHVYREENMVADALSKYGHSINHCCLIDYLYLPIQVSSLIVKDCKGNRYHK